MRRNLIATVSLLPTFLPIPAEKSGTEGVAGIVIKRLGVQIESRLGEIKSVRCGRARWWKKTLASYCVVRDVLERSGGNQNRPAERSSTGRADAAI